MFIDANMTIFSDSEAETAAAGTELVKALRPGSVVALSGGLGAGKTAFVRGIAEGLGVSSIVTSPTFTIVCEYDGAMPLFHFDAYRLSSAEELYDIGWDDYLARGGVCAVEWCGIVHEAFPDGTIYVAIEFTSDSSRRIEITGSNSDKRSTSSC